MKRQMMLARLILITLLVGGMATGCKNKAQNKQQATTQQEKATVVSEVLEVDAVLAGVENTVDKTIRIEGVCTHICRHGGKKIFLMGSDDKKTIRIEAGEKIGAFKQECINNVVMVEGILREQRIDEAYLARWEEQEKANTAEKHGEGEAGCDTEQKARGEAPASNTMERIANFRTRIAERKASEGKEYLSFYYIDAEKYNIL